jgi:hypothetical protein
MNQQPDKFFREKLEGFNKPVPSNAWNRVEARLGKKNNTALWLKVAASLTLLAVATLLLWPRPTTIQVPVAKVNPPPMQKPADNKSVAEPAEKITPSKKIDDTGDLTSAAVKKSSRTKTNVKKVEVSNDPVVAFEKTIELVQEENRTQQKAIETTVITPVVTASLEPAEEKDGVTLILTAAEVNEKYLDKKSLAEATSNEKKPSTLRKLLNKAYDLKHNQDPFGDLRQKKNEILALNFKSEKQRSQNK